MYTKLSYQQSAVTLGYCFCLSVWLHCFDECERSRHPFRLPAKLWDIYISAGVPLPLQHLFCLQLPRRFVSYVTDTYIHGELQYHTSRAVTWLLFLSVRVVRLHSLLRAIAAVFPSAKLCLLASLSNSSLVYSWCEEHDSIAYDDPTRFSNSGKQAKCGTIAISVVSATKIAQIIGEGFYLWGHYLRWGDTRNISLCIMKRNTHTLHRAVRKQKRVDCCPKWLKAKQKLTDGFP